MARNLEPKSKQERREGMNLFLKGERSFSPKNGVARRPFPPGMHGPNAKKGRRMSGYGTRLREKQKAKKIYRLLEREFHGYYVDAGNAAGDKSENLIRFLETRLDNAVYRLGYADSRDQARQLVNHGHFLINNKKITIPSYAVKVGDVISVTPTAQKKAYWIAKIPKMAKVETPGWLSLDKNTLQGKIVSLPAKQDLTVQFDPTLIVEFYSR